VIDIGKLDWDYLEPVLRDYLEPVLRDYLEQVRRDPVAPIRVGNRTIGAYYDLNGKGAEETEAPVTRFELELLCRHWAEELAAVPWMSTGVHGSRGVRVLPYATGRLERLGRILGEEKVDAILGEVFDDVGRRKVAEWLPSSGESESWPVPFVTGNHMGQSKTVVPEEVWVSLGSLGEEAERCACPTDRETYPEAPDCFQEVEWDPILIEVPSVTDGAFFEKDAGGLTLFEREVLCRFWLEVHSRVRALQEAFGESEFGAGDLDEYAFTRFIAVGEPLGFERLAAIMKEVAES
jgi:hypothetical protein